MEDHVLPAKAPAPPPREPLYWADRLRNIATIMVIAIHVAAPVAFDYPDLNTSWWWAGNIINSVSRAGVPLFVMLSGYLLLSRDYDLIDFLKRRFSRVVIPALFWMALYLFYNYLFFNNPANITDALANLVKGPVHYHLWFIYLIIGLYLVYPILRPWVRQAHERDIIYFLLLCAFGTWFYKTIYHFYHQEVGIYFELFSNNCGHFVLGYYLGKKTCQTPSESLSAQHASPATPQFSPWPFSESQMAWVGLGLVVLGSALTAGCSYGFNVDRGDAKFDVIFYDYLMPNVGIAAIGWFLMVKAWLNRWPLRPIESDFAEASFGIYFIHVFVMIWWSQLGYWHSRWHPAKALLILIVQIVIWSFITVLVIRQLPGGKKIT